MDRLEYHGLSSIAYKDHCKVPVNLDPSRGNTEIQTSQNHHNQSRPSPTPIDVDSIVQSVIHLIFNQFEWALLIGI